MATCKLCRENKAEVPDRNKPWSSRNEICLECHSARLRGDMKYILALNKKRKEKND
jgi:hypothetical protein